MVEGVGRPQTIEEVRDEEDRAFDSMVARRNVGLKIAVGVVAFDLLLLKLALEASDHTMDQDSLALGLGLTATFAFVTLLGMLVQIEIRNRDDRHVYRNATERVRAIRRGEDPDDIDTPHESNWLTVRRAWASTWPLFGTLALTVGIWVMADQFSAPPEKPSLPSASDRLVR